MRTKQVRNNSAEETRYFYSEMAKVDQMFNRIRRSKRDASRSSYKRWTGSFIVYSVLPTNIRKRNFNMRGWKLYE